LSSKNHAPPERFHVFVSYTTRENEVRIVKPIIDCFLNDVLRPIIKRKLGEPPVFYDGYTLYHPTGRQWDTVTGMLGEIFRRMKLEDAIRFAIEESEVLVAFISPEYFGSEWCKFECATMASKELRPWFDLYREPPIAELRDQRPPYRQPSRWQRIRAQFRMRRWRSHKRAWVPGGEIVAVEWKPGTDPITRFPELETVQVFDWRSCSAALETRAGVTSHLLRHGSVSPSWQNEALELEQECRQSMKSTAEAVTEILLRRRVQYAHWSERHH
jgi:hypothetical protein